MEIDKGWRRIPETAKFGVGEDPFVRVVLLNYNGGASIVSAVGAVVATDWPRNRIQIVCVDNGSTDGSLERLSSEYPEVEIVRNGKNLGFPGNNTAMRDLHGVDYVALINSDAYVESGWLRPLVSKAETDRSIGAVCPKIYFTGDFIELPLKISKPRSVVRKPIKLRSLRVNGRNEFNRCHVAQGGGRSSDRAGLFEWIFDGSVLRIPFREEDRERGTMLIEIELESDTTCEATIGKASVRLAGFGDPQLISTLIDELPPSFRVLNNVGSWIDHSWLGHERGLYGVDQGEWDRPTEVGAWCGAAVLLRSTMLEEIGLFDDEFFLYYEDSDLAVRGRERGWRYLTEPSSRVAHDHSASTIEGSALTTFYIERNRMMLAVRHAALGDVFKIVNQFLLVTFSYAAREILLAIRQSRRFDGTIVWQRLASLFGFVKKLPLSIVARRRFAQQSVMTRAQVSEAISLGRENPGE